MARASDEDAEPYEVLVARVREAVAHVVPEGATVAVATRGDEHLLDLGDRRGWHFPQLDRGVYAGHYPADSGEAIAQLERLRARGAGYLVFPRTAAWWLQHYVAFAEHLRSNYRRVPIATDSCTVFCIDGSSARSTLGTGRDQRYQHMCAELVRIVTSILPPDAAVVLVSGGDEELLRLVGMRVWDFARASNGETREDAPRDDSVVIAQLEAERHRGAEYLVLPRTMFSWLERHPALLLHLETGYRRVILQKEVCVAYDLTAPLVTADAPAGPVHAESDL